MENKETTQNLSVPVTLRFPQGPSDEGWGRIKSITIDNVKIKTRHKIKVGQSVYLTFIPQGDIRVENLRARIVHILWDEGYYIADLFFDDSVDKSYLREALVIILNRLLMHAFCLTDRDASAANDQL